MQSISCSTRKNHHRPHVRALNFGTACFVNLEKAYDCHSFIEQELHKGADAELQVGQNQSAPAFLGTPFATAKEPVHSR